MIDIEFITNAVVEKYDKEFVGIPRSIILSNEISNKAKSIWCILYTLKDDNIKFTSPTIARYMKEGVHLVRSAINELLEKELIMINPYKSNSWVYKLKR